MVADTSAGTESEDSEAQEDQSLLKVETQETSDNSDASSLLLCVQFLLRTHGIEKSIGSIRELSEQTEGEFDFSSADSSISTIFSTPLEPIITGTPA